MRQHAIDSIDSRVLGRRLREARKARGLTQQETAEALDIARTTIVALEKGERSMRPSELIRLAALYGRPVSDFMGSKEPISDMTLQFRSAVTKIASPQEQEDLRRSIQEFQLLCEDYRHLGTLNELFLQRDYAPAYSLMNYDPEDVASSERNRLGLGDGPFLHLRETLENDAGLHVFFLDLPSRVSGIFSFVHELGGCIAVNARHPAERIRWSMAHEYSHYLTNRFEGAISTLDGYNRVPAAERFADEFAGCLLMPATGLRRRFHDLVRITNGTVTPAEICQLAHFYFVSVQAMTLRLEELRLLRRGTWEWLRDKGFKVQEAREELALSNHSFNRRHLPLRYQYLAVRAYGKAEISEGTLARLLRLDRVAARGVVQEWTQSFHDPDQREVVFLPIDFTRDLEVQQAL